jgi:hypothetical protein
VTAVYRIDPLQDPRWKELVERHPRASVFHMPAWIEALRRTYGYMPVAYTTAPPGVALADGIVLSRVYSHITGRRMVSLPFSDHCEPLVDCPEDLQRLLDSLQGDCRQEGCRYLEIRPRTTFVLLPAALVPGERFYLHSIHLEPGPASVFSSFHKDSVQRKIRRAERERLTCDTGRGDPLLATFYELVLRTRRRQKLPPQPRAWFRNLVDCLGDNVTIRVASKDGRPIAGVMTLTFRDVVVYKYGCSDERFHHLGGMQFLLWNAIRDAIESRVREFDLGRSNLQHGGLIRFKDQWAATRSELTYWRYPAPVAPSVPSRWRRRLATTLFRHIPDSLLSAAGKILYKHVG